MRNVEVWVIFSRNKKIGSKLISWGTKHLSSTPPPIPSHAAFLIEERWVFESTIEKGISVSTWSKWSEKNELLDMIYLGEYDYDVIKALYRDLDGLKYDYLGVIYLGIKVLLNKLLKLPIGWRNLLESDKRYFCSEVIESLIGYDLSMVSPFQLRDLLRSRGNYEGSY